MIEMLMATYRFVEPRTTAGLVFRTTKEADMFRSIHEPTDAQAILDNWPRISNRTWIADPDDATDASAEWHYDAGQDSFVQPLNVGGSEYIVSPVKLQSYVLDMILTSPGSDNDGIGVVAAMDLVDGNVTFLTLWVQMESTTEPVVSFRFGDETNGNYAHLEGMGDTLVGHNLISRGGWNGRKVRVRISRSGGIITARNSNWDDTSNLMPDSELTVNLNELPRKGNRLTEPARYGFATNSQAGSTYLNYTIRSGEIEDDTRVYSENDNLRWVYSNGAWTQSGTAYNDFGDVDLVVNRLTKEYFTVNDSSLQYNRNNGINYGVVSLSLPASTTTSVPFDDIISNYTYDDPFTIVGVFEETELTASIGSGVIDVTSTTSNGSFYVLFETAETTNPETNAIEKTIAFRRVDVNVT